MDRQVRRVTVDDTGAATAVGGYANSGVHFGDVNLLTGVSVTTRYRQQVQRIAPPVLVDRDAELAELAKFCTSPTTAGNYLWWRARAWSGKSAMMSWFVLRPPDGVRLVSFFVTARLASQNDRAAFIDNLLEQLLALLGLQLPPFLTESTREAHMLGLLAEAAEACQNRGEQFVLVVDGLDEDRGVHDGPDSHSIAALLPTEPPAGMRIIVAGRPNPPIPADVPPHHPLRNKAIIRVLQPSPRAQAMREEMERELKRLLHGTIVAQDLLGLVAAAGGGLSAADLAELTGWSQWQVHDHLRTVTGRSFATRDSHFQAGGPEGYLLGHEELQVTALDMLGSARVVGYRQRLHAWADQYKEQRWPANTPEYLMPGYFRMLTAVDELERMIACATDFARHERMLALSGSDSAALAEIRVSQDRILSAAEPDLRALAALSYRRNQLENRNANIPPELPAVWALLGQHHRAEPLARSITMPHNRISALRHLACAMAGIGDADRAEQIALSITDPYRRAQALKELTEAAAGAGSVDRAEQIALSITDPHWQVQALIELTRLAHATDDPTRTQRLAGYAEGIVYGLVEPYPRVCMLSELARTLAEVDSSAWAHRLAADAWKSIGDVTNTLQATLAAIELARTMAKIGERGQAQSLISLAEEFIRVNLDAHRQVGPLNELVRALIDVGDLDRAEQVARSITDDKTRTNALITLVRAIVNAGNLNQADRIISGIVDANERTRALVILAAAVARVGEVRLAERISRSIVDRFQETCALNEVARTLFVVGECRKAQQFAVYAEHAARNIDQPYKKAGALAGLALTMAQSGRNKRARQLAVLVENVAREIIEPQEEREALDNLARAVADAGDYERAEQIAHRITGPSLRAGVLADLAQAFADAGDFERAEQIAHRVSDPKKQAAALAGLAQAFADAGDFERAEQIACGIHDTIVTVEARCKLARTVASYDPGLARRLAADAEQEVRRASDPYWQAWALASLVGHGAEVIDTDWVQRLINDAVQVSSAASPREQILLYTHLVRTAAKLGEFDQAHRLATLAERTAYELTEPWERATAVSDLAQAVAEFDDFERAEQMLQSVTVPSCQVDAMSNLARMAASSGDLDRAEQIAERVNSPERQAEVMSDLTRMAVSSGDLDRAEEICRCISDQSRQLAILLELVKTAAAAGDSFRVRRLTDEVEHIARNMTDPRIHALTLACLARIHADTGDTDLAGRLAAEAEQIARDISDQLAQFRTLIEVAQFLELPAVYRLIGQAFAMGPWSTPLRVLARRCPQLMIAIANDIDKADATARVD